MSVASTETIEFAVQSDRGRVRTGNEDASGHDLAQGIFVVCDGMGGAAAGEVASHMAVQTILEYWRNPQPDPAPDRAPVLASDLEPLEPIDAATHDSQDSADGTDEATVAGNNASTPDTDEYPAQGIAGRLKAAIEQANQRIFNRAATDQKLQGMGTTAIVLHVERAEAGAVVWLAHAGDSRCYRWRRGKLEQMTLDHSLVEEQVRLGNLSVAQAESSPFRNVITRAVGAMPTVEADVMRVPAESGDIYLLCSDGLTREVVDDQIAAVLSVHAAAQTPIDGACADLVRLANEHGGRDNITCLLVRIG